MVEIKNRAGWSICYTIGNWFRLRDIIAHHYFDIDADQIWWIIEKELPSLKEAIASMKKETSNIIISDKIKVLSNVEPTKSRADYKDDIMDTLSDKYY
ncbi:MAG: DUF86 domain-containing protein [Prevotella sp.]